MREKFYTVLGLAIIVLMLVGSIYWIRLQWQECREAGFSALYCVQHVL